VRLRALARREVVALITDPRSPERGQWMFGQALIREVAYGTLARRDRRTRHLAAARYFESHEGPEVAGALAFHYLDAYRAAPEGPEGEAVAGQARIALRAAADRAAGLGSHELALAYLESALEVTTDPAEEAELHLRAAASADARVESDQAVYHYRRAIEQWRQLGDRTAELGATVALARSLGSAYRLDDAVAILAPAVDAFADLAGTAEAVALLGELGRIEMLREDPAASIPLVDRALVDAEALANRPAIADLLITKGVDLGNIGRAVEGRALLEAGIRIADEDGLVLTALRGRINLSANPAIEARAGLEVARAALETTRRIGNRNLEAGLIGNYAFSALALGEWDSLLAEVERLAPDVAASPVLLGNVAQLRARRGEAVDRDELVERVRLLDPALADGVLLDADASFTLLEGRFAEAARVATRLAEISSQSAPYAWVVVGHAAAWAGDGAGTARALADLEATRVRGPELDVWRIVLRASADALDGRRQEALEGFRDAAARFRAYGHREGQTFLGIHVAATLGADEPEAAALVDEARAVMTELRAAALLERLDAALASRPAEAGPRAAKPPGVSAATPGPDRRTGISPAG
jgi:tetratricopeptide (TPR) repeat protein